MTKERKIQNVENYLQNKDTNYLKFADDKLSDLGEELKEIYIPVDTEKENFDNIVLGCLNLTSKYASISSDNKLTTHRHRWRSSLDIWRHVKYFVPECTIYDVMRSLYKNKDLLVGHYCDEIERRVFILKENSPDCELMCLYMCDEFNLIFDDWKDIGL